MNRMLRSFLILLAAVASVLAALAVGWAWRAGLIGEGDLRQKLAPGLILAIPGVMWGVLLWVSPKLASETPRLADDHRRHLQGALGFWFVILTAAQAWVAYNYLRLGPPPLDRESFARLAFILMGVAMAVRGNFVAKVSPPTGEGAPDPGRWTRSMLKTGWAMTLIGAAMVIVAMLLPVRLLALSTVIVAPALVAVSLAHRRAIRAREAP